MRTTNQFKGKTKDAIKHPQKSKAGKLAEYGILLSFFGGLLIGRFAAGTMANENAVAVQEMLFGYLSSGTGSTFSEIYISGMSGNFLLLLILLFCSYCAVGIPVIFLVIICHGVGIGLSFSSILAMFGTDALPYIAVVLLPGTVINTIVFIHCAGDAMRRSKQVFGRVFISRGVTLPPFSQEKLIVKYFIFTAALALSSLYYTLLCLNFPPLSSPI